MAETSPSEPSTEIIPRKDSMSVNGIVTNVTGTTATIKIPVPIGSLVRVILGAMLIRNGIAGLTTIRVDLPTPPSTV